MLMTTLLLIVSLAAGGDTLPTIPDIIHEEGQFVFTDGASTYQFYDDGTFFLEPASLCGRAVEGTWEWLDDNRVEIDGIWSWYNGISAVDDRRCMVIYMYLRSGETVESDILWRTGDTRLYDVYFTVEELQDRT